MMLYNSETYIPDQYEDRSIAKTAVKDMQGVSATSPTAQIFTLNKKLLQAYDNRLFPGVGGTTQVYYEV